MSDVHNAIHRFGNLIAGVRRMVGGGQDVAVERLGETLTPILNPWGLPEWAKLRGEELYAVRSIQTAVALEYAGIALSNPVGSRTIVVVDAVTAYPNTGAAFQFLEIMLATAISATYLTTTRPASVRDRRFRAVFSCKALFLQGTDVGNTFGAQLDEQAAPAGAPTVFRCLPVILRPGDALACINQTINDTLRAEWVWRERAALPGELD